jgi:hypothetical protein
MSEDFDYMNTRLEDQIRYFDNNAMRNQKAYRRLKSGAIACSVLTTLAIALSFTVPEPYKMYLGILALVSSALVLGTHQWEEFQNYGAKWEKFRLVAEQLKAEKFLFKTSAGAYSSPDEAANLREFVETVESIIKGTDISYFALLVEPGKRIEKRLEGRELHTSDEQNQ